MANPEHLKILKQGVKVWNKWREEEIWIKPDLSNSVIEENETGIIVFKVGELNFTQHLIVSGIKGARGVDLSGINFSQTNLSGSFLNRANLHKADLDEADMGGIFLVEADLREVQFYLTNLRNACLINTKLEKTCFTGAKLQGANLSWATVDGETLVDETVEVDRETYFELIGLDAMRIDPGIKQLLEYNIRRKKWEKWYQEHKFLRYIVKSFWQISDYGLSTKRVIAKFFKWAAVFALVYLFFEYSMQEGIVNNLSEVDGQQVQWWLVPIRAFYFSVVTMTTLGFGDMYAKFNSLLGHLLLTIQVLLGYMFLGALVTRFAVLFTAGGPAAKFTELTEEEKAQS